MAVRLLLLLVVLVSSEERKFQFILDTFNFSVLVPDIFEEHNFTLSQLNNRSYINGYLIFQRNIDKITLTTAMDYWKPRSKEKRRVYSFKVNACYLYETLHKNRMLGVFAKTFMNHTEGNFKCPLKAHFNYTIKNWHLKEMDFPSYTPIGTYQTTTDYFIKNIKCFSAVSRCQVVERK